MKELLLLTIFACISNGQETFNVYPEDRQAKSLSSTADRDAVILFNLENIVEANLREEEDRRAKSVDVELSLDLDPVEYKDEVESLPEEEDLAEKFSLDEEDIGDPRIEKSLLNTFPFNQGQSQDHHGHHDHHGDHDNQNDHGNHEEHHADHGEHHEEHEEGEYSVTSSVDRSPSSSPFRRPLREQLSNRVLDTVSKQVRQQLGQEPPIALLERQGSSRFPFQGSFRQDDSEAQQDDQEDQNAVSFNVIGEAASRDEEVKGGRKCIDKVMMVEVTEYNEVITCDHSYDKRCHTSYVTHYDTQQEEECEENFKKICNIQYEPLAYNETVEICRTPLVKDCSTPSNETVCQTVYETECTTKQKVHEVEDDVTNCETQQMTKCKDVTVGYVTKPECDTWPVERCTLEKKLVKKYTPETACHKEPRELCAPRGCGYRDGSVECHEKIKTIVVDNPQETCEIEPQRVCKHVTKLVPKLTAVQECVDVPKEICARSTNPTKVKKPIIKKWCYVPSKESGLE